MCIRPGLCLCLCVSVLRALVACKKSLVAKEFSRHRHRSFRLVIASLQIGATAQRRVQPTDKEKLRGACRKQTSDRREVCVCVSVLGCVYASVYPSCARWLLAKKFGCKRVFAASSSCITQPTASYNVRLNLTDTTSQACSWQTACCCGSAGRKGSRQSEANERGCCEAQRPGEF